MYKNNNVSTGQIIRRIRVREIAPVYAIYGGDFFLEDFFINELRVALLIELGSKLHFFALGFKCVKSFIFI